MATSDADDLEGPRQTFGRLIQQQIDRLRAKEPQLTRDLVARRAGMSRQHLWRGIRGSTRFTPFEIAQLARVLSLNPYELAVEYLRFGRRFDGWSDAEQADFARNFQPNPTPVAPTKQYVSEEGAVYELIVDATRPLELPAAKTLIGVELSRDMHILAEEFKLEALRAGADDDEMSFIRSVLNSPEAIFRQSGYRGLALPREQQAQELEAVITMLRAWLTQHIRRRAARDKDLIAEDPGA